MLRCALILLCVLAVPVRAEVRAVLVGVGDYLHLDADLQGPPQDVALMAGVLTARGVARGAMQVLGAGTGDQGPGPGPSRAEIMAALEHAATQSRAGDTVVFYFSGHGAQVPDVSGDEGGGMDEALLPADVRGSGGVLENALLDDDLQLWAAGLLARGVAVVGVIDACHSATGFRALGGAGRARGLTAQALGLPPDGSEAGSGAEPGAERAAALAGDFVFLYSSQSDQRSFEYPLGDTGVWHGEFTLRLAEVLRTAPGASWRQVLAATTDAMVQGPARQMPEGEGPLLDAGIFGVAPGSAPHAAGPGGVAAGLLQGLAEGAEVAFYAQAAGGAVLGQGVLGQVGLRQAAVTGAVPQGAAWAEVVTQPAPPALRLAPAVRADGLDYAAWEAALSTAGGTGGPVVDLTGGPVVDLVPILTEGGVALAGPDGVLDPAGPGSTPRIAQQAGEAPDAAVARVLAQAAHALRLRAVFAGAAGRSLTGGPGLDVAYTRAPGCGAASAAPAVPVDPARGLAPCDNVWISVTNRGAKPVDLSVLYFNADFTVSPIWPRMGLANRLARGETVRTGLQIAADSGFALEELMILGVPVEPDAPRVDLTRLADPAMTRGSSGGSGVMWFEGRMDPAVSRGFSAKPPLVLVRQGMRIIPQQ